MAQGKGDDCRRKTQRRQERWVESGWRESLWEEQEPFLYQRRKESSSRCRWVGRTGGGKMSVLFNDLYFLGEIGRVRSRHQGKENKGSRQKSLQAIRCENNCSEEEKNKAKYRISRQCQKSVAMNLNPCSLHLKVDSQPGRPPGKSLQLYEFKGSDFNAP